MAQKNAKGRKTKTVKKRVRVHGPKPNMSFAQLATQFAQNEMKEFVKSEIRDQIGAALDQLGRVLQNRIDVAVGGAGIQLRALEEAMLEAFPKKLNEEDLDKRRIEIEEELLDQTVVEGEIEKGDYVRFTLNIDGNEQRMSRETIGEPPFDLTEEFDKQLIGMKTGESKTVTYNLFGQEVEGEVFINRVSRGEKQGETESSEQE